MPPVDKGAGNAKKVLSRRGRVVGIIRRNWRQLAGSLDLTSLPTANAVAEDATMVLFRPHKKGLPPMLLTTRRAEVLPVSATCILFLLIQSIVKQVLRGQWVVAVMDQWPTWSPHPMGHYVSLLGPLGDKTAETKLVLHEFGVPHEAFSPAVMVCGRAVIITMPIMFCFRQACLPSSDWKITEEIAKEGGRVDLRHIPVVSIDPPGCKARRFLSLCSRVY